MFEEIEFRAATVDGTPAGDGVPQPRPRDRASTTSGPATSSTQTFQNDAGIVDFVRHLNHAKEPLFKDVGSFSDSGPEGEVEVAWQWNTGYHEGLHSYANGISTTEGGMHAEGFKRALTPGDQPLRQGAQPA